jgi:hypothetical protein
MDDYRIDPDLTADALAFMGVAVFGDCTARTHAECLLCPKERQCAFINATLTALTTDPE